MSTATGSTVRRCTWRAAAAVFLAAAMAAIAWAVPARVQAQPLGQARSEAPGYLLDKGRLLGFDIPGATVGATVTGVNDRNQIVGKFNDGTAPTGAGAREHGFLRDPRGGFTTIDLPGATGTATARINDRGQIAGVYSQNTGRVGDDPNRRGFLLDHGRLIRIDAPRAVYTQGFGLNDLGQVVGEFQDPDGLHAFRWDRGRFTTLDFPGAVATSALGINNRGQIVGIYFDDLTARPGTVPGAPRTTATGINDRGAITGNYANPNAPTAPQVTGMRSHSLDAVRHSGDEPGPADVIP